MKIAILTAFWKRDETLKIFIKSIEYLREQIKVDLVAVGSERRLIPDWAKFVRFKNKWPTFFRNK